MTPATASRIGDLSRKITVNVSGEILEHKDSMNTIVDQHNAFAGEVTRVRHHFRLGRPPERPRPAQRL